MFNVLNHKKIRLDGRMLVKNTNVQIISIAMDVEYHYI